MAGVLVSQWDIHHQENKPWLPNAPDWEMGDHFTGTIKNRMMGSGLWGRDLPGFVVAPMATRVLCSYSADGTTQGDLKACRRRHHDPVPADCIPGCNLDRLPIWCNPGLCNATGCVAYPNPTYYLTIESVSQPGRTLHSDCAWPPASLQWMLKQQALRNRATNEVVFDSRPITDGFPASLEAFFVPDNADADRRRWVQATHRAFLDEYGASAEEVALLTFNYGVGDHPFQVM